MVTHVDEVLNEDVIYNIFEIRNHDNYTYLHSVKVGAIAIIMGKPGLARTT